MTMTLDPRTAIPCTDADTAPVVATALRCLLARRGVENLGDPIARLSARQPPRRV